MYYLSFLDLEFMYFYMFNLVRTILETLIPKVLKLDNDNNNFMYIFNCYIIECT